MTRARPPHFLGPPAIFEAFIALLGFQCGKLQILCDVFATCIGLVQPREGQALPPGAKVTSAACPIQPLNMCLLEVSHLISICVCKKRII
jgi:hypothetical protein